MIFNYIAWLRLNIRSIISIGENNKVRLTVPPGLWFGFKGLSSEESIILNISNMMHSDEEVERKKTNDIEYDWKM